MSDTTYTRTGKVSIPVLFHQPNNPTLRSYRVREYEDGTREYYNSDAPSPGWFALPGAYIDEVEWDDESRFGQTVRTLREKAGWSVPELARRANLARTQLYALENGTRTPACATVTLLATAFNLSPTALGKLMYECFGEAPPE